MKWNELESVVGTLTKIYTLQVYKFYTRVDAEVNLKLLTIVSSKMNEERNM